MNKNKDNLKATYTLEDVGCYVDGARGIYAIDAIAKFAEAHGYVLDADEKDDRSLSESEFANEIEDEIDDYMNANYGVEGAYWGRNENGDWGLWETEGDAQDIKENDDYIKGEIEAND